jgi:hypothetical protein
MFGVLAPRIVLVSAAAAPPHRSSIRRLMSPARPVVIFLLIVLLMAPGAEFDLHALKGSGFHFFDAALQSNDLSEGALQAYVGPLELIGHEGEVSEQLRLAGLERCDLQLEGLQR